MNERSYWILAQSLEELVRECERALVYQSFDGEFRNSVRRARKAKEAASLTHAQGGSFLAGGG